MTRLLLVVEFAGQRVALPSSETESVVELDTLVPVPRAPPHVAGLSALRSRVLTVIDARRSLDLGDTDCAEGIREAVVVELDGHHYAVIVDQVSDVIESQGEPSPVRGAMEAGWARVARGVVETELGAVLLIDVAALISGPEQSRTAA